MPAFYEQTLWIPKDFLLTNPDLHHGLLGWNLEFPVELRHSDSNPGCLFHPAFSPDLEALSASLPMELLAKLKLP